MFNLREAAIAAYQKQCEEYEKQHREATLRLNDRVHKLSTEFFGYPPDSVDRDMVQYGDLSLRVREDGDGKTDIRIWGKCPACHKENVISGRISSLSELGRQLVDFYPQVDHYDHNCPVILGETETMVRKRIANALERIIAIVEKQLNDNRNGEDCSDGS